MNFRCSPFGLQVIIEKSPSKNSICKIVKKGIPPRFPISQSKTYTIQICSSSIGLGPHHLQNQKCEVEESLRISPICERCVESHKWRSISKWIGPKLWMWHISRIPLRKRRFFAKSWRNLCACPAATRTDRKLEPTIIVNGWRTGTFAITVFIRSECLLK